MPKDEKSLMILLAAFNEQLELVDETIPILGWDPKPFEENLDRLESRLDDWNDK